MSRLTGISFVANGANAEQRFQELVDKYLAGQESVSKTLEDGTQIFIHKQNLGDRGIARYVNIYDNVIGWEFVLYPAANSDPDTKLVGLKYAMRTLNMPEATGSLDSGDLGTLEQFLSEVM